MILIVDDHIDSGAALARLLKLEGYEAMAVGSGLAALEILKGVRPQVIVLDMHMPDIDGLAVLRQVRADAKVADVPVVLYTSDTDYTVMRQAKTLGAAEYLVKGTLSWDELCARIAEHAGEPTRIARHASEPTRSSQDTNVS